jgi:hypothetical protein
MAKEQLTDEEYQAYTEEYARVQMKLRHAFRQGILDNALIIHAERMLARICAYTQSKRRATGKTYKCY